MIPWSAFWDRNYFAAVIPGLQDLITNNFFRGAISGLGALNLLAAGAELVDMFSNRRVDDPASLEDKPFHLTDRHAP